MLPVSEQQELLSILYWDVFNDDHTDQPYPHGFHQALTQENVRRWNRRWPYWVALLRYCKVTLMGPSVESPTPVSVYYTRVVSEWRKAIAYCHKHPEQMAALLIEATLAKEENHALWPVARKALLVHLDDVFGGSLAIGPVG